MNTIGVGLLLTLSLAAGPGDTPLPIDVRTWDSNPKLMEAFRKLPTDDRRVLGAFVKRKLAAGLHDEGVLIGLTVREAIADQKQWEKEQQVKANDADELARKLRQQAQDARDAMNKIVTVALLEKTMSVKGFQDMLTLKLAIDNKSDKRVVGVKGKLIFKDVFGNSLNGFVVSTDQPIAPKATGKPSMTMEFSHFNAENGKVINTPLNQLRYEWVPVQYVFDDGTALALEAAAE